MENNRSGFCSKRLQNITDYLRRIVDEGNAAGVSGLVIRHGEEVFRKSFGYADIAKSKLLKDDSIFRIYSMTKTFTVVAAMTLYEKGLFKLSDPVYEYIPSFKKMSVAETDERGIITIVDAKIPVTIHHLFTMTSGIAYPGRDSYSAGILEDIHANLFSDAEKGILWDTAKLVDAAASAPLCFQPGSYFHYGFSHDILGRIIEIISGKKFSDYMADTILKPLGLKDTAFYVPKEKLERLSKVYAFIEDEKLKELEILNLPPDRKADRNSGIPNFVLEYGRFPLQTPPSFESGGAGLVSTIDDIGRYALMLLNFGKSGDKRILSRKTIELIRQSHVTDVQAGNFFPAQIHGYGYGLGVRTMTNIAGAGLNGSPGEWAWDGALGTWYCVDPIEDLIAVFMLQRWPGAGEDLAKRFAQTVYGAIDD